MENLAALSSSEQQAIFVKGVFQKYGPEALRLLTSEARTAITFDSLYDHLADLDHETAKTFIAAVMDGAGPELMRFAAIWRNELIAAYVSRRHEAKVWELYNGRDD